MADQSFGGKFMKTLRRIFFSIVSMLAITGLLTMLSVGFLTYFAVKHSGDMGAGVKSIPTEKIENSVVHFDMNGPLVSQSVDPKDKLLASFFGGPKYLTVSSIRRTLDRIKTDDRVKAVSLDLSLLSANFVSITDLRRALEEFRASKKKVYIHLASADSLTYYLASVADRINLSPVGGIMAPGPVFQLTYFGPALKKLGLNFEVFRAGTYKSAFEPFVAERPSQPTLDMYEDLERSLRLHMVDTIAKGRRRPVDQVAEWLKVSSFTSEQALSKGLVDRIGYVEKWEEELKGELETSNKVPWKAYLSQTEDLENSRLAEGEGERLAYIQALGDIRMGGDDGGSRDGIDPESLGKRLKWALNDDSIKAVVLRVDSPGGSALASDLIWADVKKLAAKKPVVVSMGSVAASGGYYISAPATHIMAEASTITGSIGVIGAAVSGERFADKYGVNFYSVTQSDRKDYLNFGTPASKEDREVMAESIDAIYQTFITKVAEGRKKDVATVDKMAQGRVYTGQRALELGLVDSLGGLNEAFKRAKILAKLDPEKLYPLGRYQGEPKSILDCLARQDDMLQCIGQFQSLFTLSSGVLGPVEQRSLDKAQRVMQMLQEDKALSYWPADIHWGR
jgi:protease-4